MKIYNQSFPHPVLGLKDDVQDTFEVEFNWECDRAFFYLRPIFRLNNSTLEHMLKSNEAKYAVEVECANTFYRNTFYSDKTSPQFNINAELLRNKVNLIFFIISNVNKEDYTITNSHPDYGETKFNISTGDVLAYGGKTDFLAVKNYDSLKAVSSIMEIKKGEYDQGLVKTDFYQDKIKIILSREDYENYKLLSSDPSNIPIFHTSLVFPVLYKALIFIDEVNADYAQFKWFDVIKTRIDDEDLSLSDDEKHIEVIQKLFGNPYRRLFEALRAEYEEDENYD